MHTRKVSISTAARALLLASAFSAAPLNAAVLVSDRSGLAPDDGVVWPGENDTTQPNPLVLTSPGGISVTASKPSSDAFVIFHEGTTDWNGMFNDGEHVLYTGDGIFDPIEITFGTPVGGAGANLQPGSFGDFFARVTAYDSSDTPIFSYTTPDPISSTSERGTAPFFGVQSSANDIKRIVFEAFEGNSNPQQFGINQLSIQELAPIPEPHEYAMLFAAGLLVFGLSRRMRSRQRGPQ